MARFLRLLSFVGCFLSTQMLFAEGDASERLLPGAYHFKTPEAKATWSHYLPQGSTFITPTCAYNKADKTIYALAEYCGLSEGYEIEFILIGNLSDRAYESVMIAWDGPSAIQKAAVALGVPMGEEANVARGMPMARGERFTIDIAPLPTEGEIRFTSLSEVVSDACSTPAQALFQRGFPYVGGTVEDDYMPCSIVATYTGCHSLFGMPYFADKSGTYGLFRAKQTQDYGTPVIVAFRWQKLPDEMPRVQTHTLELTPTSIANPDALIAQLKAYCDSPADVFLDVRLDTSMTVQTIKPMAELLLALEAQGGFTIMEPAEGQISIRAFLPKEEWKEREGRLFQPWEIEVSPGKDGAPADVTLCQIEEDWNVEGLEPALTRHCYPAVKPETILSVMKRVDVNDGRVYVAFFYCAPETPLKELIPYAEAIKAECPTQWIFIQE